MKNIEEVLKLNNVEFINYTKSHDDFLTNEEVLKRVTTLEQKHLVLLLRNLDEVTYQSILNKKELIENSNQNFVKSLVLNTPTNLKKSLVKDPFYIKKILTTKPGIHRKNMFDLYDFSDKVEILKRKDVIDEVNTDLYFDLLKSLDNKSFIKIINELKPTGFFQNFDSLFYYMDSKYQLFNKDQELVEFIKNKFNQNLNLSYYLLKIDTFEQLYLFQKFDLLLNITVNDEIITFEDKSTIDFKLLKHINKKHVSSLIETMKQKEPEAKEHHLLINAVKLYSIFDYAEAKKIVEDKFTHMTEMALNRAAKTYAIDQRREYRLSNQEEFYSNKVLEKAKNAYDNNDIKYFEKLLKITKEEAKYATALIKEEKLDLCTLIKSGIEKREKIIVNELMQKYIKETNSTPNKVNTEDLYDLLFNVEIANFNYDKKGRVIPNEDLINLLLGNKRKDNDALLRLMLNKKAFGLEKNLGVIINEFEVIKDLCAKDDKINLNSIPDLIGIVKMFVYSAKPDEEDITLENFVKLYNNNDHIEGERLSTFKKALKLHKKRRKKIASSIPIVSGETSNITYEVMDFHSPELITLGIETGSCFKVGAFGDDFLRYIMLGKNGAIVSLKDQNSKRYICPLYRNGNSVLGNGIDPKPESEEIRISLLNAMEECASKMIEKSHDDEKIDFVTITDLNQLNMLEHSKYEEIDMNYYIPREDTFHTDYLMSKNAANPKDRRRSYVLSKNGKEPMFKSYDPKELYYLKRNLIYEVVPKNEEDLEKINIMINLINYTMSNNDEKSEYKKINAKNYEYIIGNKDWFIAIDENKNVLAKIMPYDKRALDEYYNILANLKEIGDINERYCCKKI